MITGCPINVRGAMITGSSVPFPDTGETAIAEIPYTPGQTVSNLIDNLHHKFECKANVTVSFSDADTMPQAYPADEQNAYWIDLGAVNQEAPFQRERTDQNDAASPYWVTVDPGGRVSAIGIGYILADDVTIEVFDATAALIYTETRQLLKRNVFSFKSYIQAPVRQITKVLFDNLPMASTNTFKLTFTRASGNIKVGAIIPTSDVDIGSAQYRAKVRRENFSKVVRDTFTNPRIIKKRNIPTRKMQLHIEKRQLDTVLNTIDDLNGEVTFWYGDVEHSDGYFESLFTIGFYKDFAHSLDHVNDVFADIEIQEL